MWVGSFDGLLHFDGVRFNRFNSVKRRKTVELRSPSLVLSFGTP